MLNEENNTQVEEVELAKRLAQILVWQTDELLQIEQKVEDPDLSF